jgi:FMN phosphatase YigB (HAD superfamily)
VDDVTDPRPILVADFDGTVYRGDAPIRFYARRIAESLGAADATAYLDAFERFLSEGVKASEAYEDTATARILRGAYDAWGVALILARSLYGAPDTVTQEAFLFSRVQMLGDNCPLERVDALVEAFAELRPDVRIVLATNSPAEGLRQLLVRLGVADLFDEVVAGAGKPEGLRRWLVGAIGDGPPDRVFSLGDHYRNEIEPAVTLGAAAGYIDRFGRADGPATATGPRAEEILPALRAWAHAH